MENADSSPKTGRSDPLSDLVPGGAQWDHLRERWGDIPWPPELDTVLPRLAQRHDVVAMVAPDAGLLAPGYYLVAESAENPVVVLFADASALYRELSVLPRRVYASTTVITGDMDHAEFALRLRDIATQRARLIFVTADRLRQAPLLRVLRLISARLWVIPEAHRFSLLSSDAHPDYLALGTRLGDVGNPPLLAITPAVSSPVLNDMCAAVHRSLQVIQGDVIAPHIHLAVRLLHHERDKDSVLLSYLSTQLAALSGTAQQPAPRARQLDQRRAGIIYTATPGDCVRVTRLLTSHGCQATALHHELPATDHIAIQEAFADGRSPIVVTTAPMGHTLSRADVRFVLHYQPAWSLEDYVLECGQAGHDGQPASCLTLVSPDDRAAAASRIRTGRLHIDQLRAVYAALGAARRARLPASVTPRDEQVASWRLVSKRVLVEAANSHIRNTHMRKSGHEPARAVDQDSARMALGILERVGLIRQHLDFPRAAVLSLRPAKEHGTETQTENWQRFLQVSGLQRSPGGVTIDPVALCAELGWTPPLVEETLLTWHDSGLLTYRGVGRDMLIEMRAVPPDVHEALPGLLAAIDACDSWRLQSWESFWDTTLCRRAVLASYFENASSLNVAREPIAPCSACDRCR